MSGPAGTTAVSADPLGFDLDALREKYRQERDKRLRPDSNAQYHEVKDDLAHFIEDPYAHSLTARSPLHDDVDVLVIGGGSGYDLTGRDGVVLSKHWKAGMRSLHGMLSRGFPNCLVMGIQQAGFTANFSHASGEQATQLAYVIAQAMQRGASTVEPDETAENDWVRAIIDNARMNEDFQASCTPGCYNNEGQPAGRNSQNAPYGPGPIAYFELLQSWRDKGQCQGLVFA